MKRVSALIIAVMIAVFSIPQLRVHAEGSGVIGAFVYDGSADFFSGEQQTTAQMLYKLTKSEYNQHDFGSILSNIPASSNGYTNYVLYCSNSTLSLSYFPDGVFCVFDDNFSSENRSSYASRFGLSSISNYGVYFYDYIQDDNSPTPFELFTCNLSSGEWGTSQTSNLYYTNLGTEEHYNYYSAGKKTLIGGNCPVYSVAEAVDYDTTKSQSNMYMPIIIENMDSLTNFNAGNIPVFDGTSMVVPEPDVEIESISNHLYANSFDVFFCNTRQLMSNPYGMANIGGGYLCVKYDLDDYARANIGSLVLSFNYSCTFGETVYTGAYQGRLDSSGYVIIPINQAFQNNPYFMAKYDMVLATSKNTFYQDFCEMKPYYFTRTQWDDYKEVYQDYLPGGIDDTPQEHQLTAQKLEDILSNSPFVYMVDKYENINIPTLPASAVVMKNLGYVLDGKVEIYSPDLSVAKFDCVCKLMNEQDIFETSGEFKKTINFKTGVSSITDNGITINPNPFDGTGTYDIVPTDSEYGFVSGGTAYATVGNIVNQITIPGYRELKADIDANPDGNFTQFLAPFYNNEVGAWFFSFVDDMPPEMKTILISGCGVGVLFGIARYVRRS